MGNKTLRQSRRCSCTFGVSCIELTNLCYITSSTSLYTERKKDVYTSSICRSQWFLLPLSALPILSSLPPPPPASSPFLLEPPVGSVKQLSRNSQSTPANHVLTSSAVLRMPQTVLQQSASRLIRRASISL